MVHITKHGTCNRPIKGFAGLKSKIYTFTTEDNHESKKAKGINKNAVNDELKYVDYKNVLLNSSYTKHEMDRIKSKDYDIGSYRTNKISLSYYDDKKHKLEDGTFSHFNKSTLQPYKNNFAEYRQFLLIFCFDLFCSDCSSWAIKIL